MTNWTSSLPSPAPFSASDRAQRLHDSPWQGVFHVTGGGSGFLAELLGTAGASRSVLEAAVPYSAASLSDLLGGPPDQACSSATARALAMAALQRAMQLRSVRPFGFAASASLATDRVKRGRLRAHIAVQTATHGFHTELIAFSDPNDRAVQERELADAAWDILLTALGLFALETGTPAPREGAASTQVSTPAAGPSPRTATQSVEAAPEWRALVEGRRNRASTAPHDGALLFPGSFNPLHEGHRRMMAIAEARLGRRGAFELSIENPDKPLLDYLEIRARLDQLDRPVWLTRLPTFAEKAREFPGATFVAGMDTLVRIADPRYYGGVRQRDGQLTAMLGHGVRFLVFGRLLDGDFAELGKQPLPPALMQCCTPVGEAEFRMDLSSTAIRSEQPGRPG